MFLQYQPGIFKYLRAARVREEVVEVDDVAVDGDNVDDDVVHLHSPADRNVASSVPCPTFSGVFPISPETCRTASSFDQNSSSGVPADPLHGSVTSRHCFVSLIDCEPMLQKISPSTHNSDSVPCNEQMPDSCTIAEKGDPDSSNAPEMNDETDRVTCVSPITVMI